MVGRRLRQGLLAVLGGYSLLAQAAPLEVQAPWVRATVAQQSATGAFMTLRASEPLRVVAARSALAQRIEIHEMTLEQQVMRMRERPALVLAAGQTLELKPGSWHLMLLGLTEPLIVGQTVPVVLTVHTQAGQRYELRVPMPVRPLNHAHGAMPVEAPGHHAHPHH